MKVFYAFRTCAGVNEVRDMTDTEAKARLERLEMQACSNSQTAEGIDTLRELAALREAYHSPNLLPHIESAREQKHDYNAGPLAVRIDDRREAVMHSRLAEILLVADSVLTEAENALLHPDSARSRNRAFAALGVLREAVNSGCMLPSNFQTYLRDKITVAKPVKLPCYL